jgi:hypothetical protein
LNPLDFLGPRPRGADSPDLAPLQGPGPDARETARQATIRAIARWREATAWVKAMEAAGDAADPTNKWCALAVDDMIEAESALVLSLLAWEEGFKDWDRARALQQHREPRGVVSGGVGYFAVPDPDRDECESKGDVHVMRLAIVPMGSVEDLDG